MCQINSVTAVIKGSMHGAYSVVKSIFMRWEQTR
jgi:hypothetical protein